MRETIRTQTGKDVAVIVTDSFGRPFRRGTTDVAIGSAGIAPLADLRGTADRAGSLLRSTQVAVADELAAAANLVRMNKADGLPVVIVRGVGHARGEGSDWPSAEQEDELHAYFRIPPDWRGPWMPRRRNRGRGSAAGGA